jgi:hypothetical protein
MKNMSANHKIQKTTGGVVHVGSWMGNEADPRTSKYGYFTPSCGSGVVYTPATLRNSAAFRELPQDTKVTCKKCLKLIEKAEYLGLHLKVVDNEDGSSKVVDTREEVAPEPEAETPAVYDHAAVAQIRANIDAEEEERAAARRARNRTNYAPAPTAHEDDTITREPEDRTLTEVEEMEDQYQDLVLIGRGLHLLSDKFCRMLAEMKDGEGLDEGHSRVQRIKRKLDRNLKLEGENLAQRTALAEKIREARKTGRCLMRGGAVGGRGLQCLQLRGHSGDCKNSRGETFTNWLDPEAKVYAFGSKPEEKPFHRQVKDAIGLKW